MLKRLTGRFGWNGLQLGAGLCVIVSVALIAVALLQKDSGAQPDWQVMNEQVNRALAPLEQREADKLKSDEKKAAEAGSDGGETAAEGMTAKENGKTAEAPSTAAEGIKADDLKAGVDGTGAEDQAIGGSQGNGAAAVSAKTGTDTSNQAGQAVSGRGVPIAGADTEAGTGKNTEQSSDGKIDVNHATAAELDALPGIGAAKAAAIVEDRSRNGSFRSIDDLLRVKGIGPKLLDKMKSYIVLQP